MITAYFSGAALAAEMGASGGHADARRHGGTEEQSDADDPTIELWLAGLDSGWNNA